IFQNVNFASDAEFNRYLEVLERLKIRCKTLLMEGRWNFSASRKRSTRRVPEEALNPLTISCSPCAFRPSIRTTTQVKSHAALFKRDREKPQTFPTNYSFGQEVIFYLRTTLMSTGTPSSYLARPDCPSTRVETNDRFVSPQRRADIDEVLAVNWGVSYWFLRSSTSSICGRKELYNFTGLKTGPALSRAPFRSSSSVFFFDTVLLWLRT
ncbi:hypothetical protein M413DRAFT_444517, partial [Hebeloma cylindrosporum]